MEAGNATATNKRKSVAENNTRKSVKSSERASLSKRRKKEGIPQVKTIKKNLDGKQIPRSNSANVAFDNSVGEYGSDTIMVSPNVPLPTDAIMLVEHVAGADGQFYDQEKYVNLKARVKELREENHRLSCKLQDEAKISLQLKEENKILLDELKLKCGPDVISSLEAKNPDQSSQS